MMSCVLLVLLAVGGSLGARAPMEKPNIIMFFVDGKEYTLTGRCHFGTVEIMNCNGCRSWLR